MNNELINNKNYEAVVFKDNRVILIEKYNFELDLINTITNNIWWFNEQIETLELTKETLYSEKDSYKKYSKIIDTICLELEQIIEGLEDGSWNLIFDLIADKYFNTPIIEFNLSRTIDN